MNKLIKNLKIHIYADGANSKEVAIFNKLKYVKGFTTNPSLMKNNNVLNYKTFAKEILKAARGKPVSFEVFADDHNEILKQANTIKSWGSNIFVKIPYYNSKGKSNLNLIKILSKQNVKVNITSIFNYNQVRNVFNNINKNSHSILSIFAGRVADTGRDPIEIVKKAVQLTRGTKKIKILWASCRETYSIFTADKIGCDIITVPESILKKMKIIGKNLDKYSVETSKQFFLASRGINFN